MTIKLSTINQALKSSLSDVDDRRESGKLSLSANLSVNESQDKFVVSQINRLTPLWRWWRSFCTLVGQDTTVRHVELHRTELHQQADMCV
ncbi:hypothetical protein K0M31_016012 [Melipona bicolor]|uniref:Uncharacterized protein n=1 Tax=Melipona bicolor TaxID=60889 RepID=A0AA40KT24_9HYME|nr:hypothetical protein K0M31_016012 [Melipona bicolor]